MRVAVYVRVSTSRQVKLQTIEQQLERVGKHVREKGWELPKENVFVLSPDRLARNYVHQMVFTQVNAILSGLSAGLRFERTRA